MRLTMHNGRAHKDGRVFSASHNDRSAKIKHAENIDPTRSGDNIVMVYDFETGEMKPQDVPLETHERRAYQKLFGQSLAEQNERNERARHPERNKNIDDLLNNKMTAPEQFIIQVGNRDEHITPEELERIAERYVEDFNKKYGERCLILDYAVHLDEQTPHVQGSRVWFALDKNNKYFICSQNKALEQLGIKLPEKDKTEHRYNNRKMTFTAEDRAHLQEIVKEECPGYDIELPDPNVSRKKSMELNDYIIAKQKTELENLKSEIESVENDQKLVEEIEEEKNDLVKWFTKFKERILNSAKEKAEVVELSRFHNARIDKAKQKTSIKNQPDFVERLNKSYIGLGNNNTSKPKKPHKDRDER